MRTTINIDDSLFDELMALTKSKTKTQAVRKALKEYLRMNYKKQLLAMRGEMDIENNWEDLRRLETLEVEDQK